MANSRSTRAPAKSAKSLKAAPKGKPSQQKSYVSVAAPKSQSKTISAKNAKAAPAKKVSAPVKAPAKKALPAKAAAPAAKKATPVKAVPAKPAPAPVAASGKGQKAVVAAKGASPVAAPAKGARSAASGAKGKNSAAAAAAAAVDKVTGRLVARQPLEVSSDAVCREVACEGLGTTAGYCRLHYIKNWRKIKRKEVILRERKLNIYIEELVAKYPEKYLEAIRQDLTNDKDFAKVIRDLDLDENIDEFEGEGGEGDAVIDTIKRDFDDETETF